jgi:ryanodine receptor 2
MAVLSTHKSKDKTIFLRVGWANTEGFKPFFGTGGLNLLGSIGDDLSSIGFDGQRIWVGGHSVACTMKPERKRLVKQALSVQSPDWSPKQNLQCDQDGSQHCLKQGDIVGCLLDLQNQTVKFTLNGKEMSSFVSEFDVSGTFCPVVSMSSGVKCSLRFGRNFGLFNHPPPSGYAPMFEAIVNTVSVERCVSIGNIIQGEIEGLPALMDYSGYVPAPVDTTHVEVPSCLDVISDDLAENIHEVWAVNKINEGFTYGPTRNDDLKHNPCLTSFKNLSKKDKAYDVEMAFQTIRTLLALGYQIGIESTKNKDIPKLQLDRTKFTMPNGYRPQPLDLSAVPELPAHLDKLVDLLAKNAHDVWARSRISEGWRYGKAKDGDHKRNPLLVPYEKLHQEAKESNRCTAFESVRTILAFGYTLQPPSGEEQSVQELSRGLSSAEYSCRTYRCQYTSAVSTGRWYIK